jgi:Fe2+ transport system protein FeoA
VVTDNAEAIRYLQGQGIRPGTRVVLEAISPFDGPVTVRVASKVLHLGRRLAQVIHLTAEVQRRGARMKVVRERDGAPGREDEEEGS